MIKEILTGGEIMSKVVYKTNLKEITKIRLKCNNCGAVVEKPISPNMTTHFNCINCNKEFPKEYSHAFLKLRDAVLAVFGKLEYDDESVSIEILTEKEN